jgi:uncharacterized protein YqhQ
VFVIVSIFVFSLLAGQDLIVSIVGRIALIPVIAAVSYEVLRFGARHRTNVILRWLFKPGIWLQRITTRQPDEGMVEVAIAAMVEALRVNGDEAPAGSADPPRRPLAEVEAEAARAREAAAGDVTPERAPSPER